MNSGQYWSEVAESGGEHIAYPMWRAYCDALHARLLRSWLEGSKFSTALKTDLFDEACGNGMVSELEQIADRVNGLDISRSIVQRAARRHPSLHAMAGDVREISLDDGSVDFVLSNSTLDHFTDSRDLERSVCELVRILVPGGVLLLTLDNPLNPVVALRNKMPSSLLGRTALAPYFVGHTLSLSPMVRMLESHGCEIRQKAYIMHVPRIVFLHLCRWFDQETSTGRTLLRTMLGFEILGRLPTSPLTGHFAAALAVKKP